MNQEFSMSIPGSITDPAERKACCKKYKARYRAKPENKEKALAYNRAYHKAHPETKRLWRELNREKLLIQDREREKTYRPKYREKNRELIRLRRQKWYLLNRERVKAKSKRHYLENKEMHKASVKAYREKHHGWLLQQKVIDQGRRRAMKMRNGMSECADSFYKFVRSRKKISCYYCGVTISGKDAHIDHVIAVSKAGNHASSNLCASCQKCNLVKHTKMPSELSIKNQPLLNL